MLPAPVHPVMTSVVRWFMRGLFCCTLAGSIAVHAANNESAARSVSSGRLSAPQNLILQGIQITDNSDNYVIEIELGQTLHYMRHFPFASGSSLQIQLQPPPGGAHIPGR